jgi:peptidyl-prolyl cis-trans isomerase B (cyclophilin B)
VRTSLALIALLGLAPAALAQDLTPATLQLSTAVESSSVPVGGTINVAVRLLNTTTSPIEVLGVEDGKLVEDRAVVSFDIQLDDGRTFNVTRIHPDAAHPRSDWHHAIIDPGKAVEVVVGFPALTRGAWRITAGYRRNTPQALTAAPVVVNVVPAEGGATDVEATMITTMGPIRLRLFPRDALGTCLNFARLITEGGTAYGKTRPRWYDGLTFHRVIPNFMIQGGCPLGNGMGDPGFTIPAEFPQAPIKDNLKNVPGRLAMARTNDPDSAGCQFFIDCGTPAHLDGQYTVFGEVSRGLDVVYAIANVDTKPTEDATSNERSRPVEPVRIISMRLGLAAPTPVEATQPPGH